MALFNYATKEITLKIVYYGPGLSGKTTNIQNLHSVLNSENKGKLLSLSTESDRTLFFDFLPVELGKIKEFSIRFQLYTVPGQVRYNATRKVVLKGADGVVFVADSQRDMRDQNIESFENMRDNLISNNINPDEIPLILQYNKRDLNNILTIDDLNRDINKDSEYSIVEAEAINGKGVKDTFQSITRLVLKDIARKHKIEIQPAFSKDEVMEEEKSSDFQMMDLKSFHHDTETKTSGPAGHVPEEELDVIEPQYELEEELEDEPGEAAVFEKVDAKIESELNKEYEIEKDVYKETSVGIKEVKEAPVVSADKINAIVTDVANLKAMLLDITGTMASLREDVSVIKNTLTSIKVNSASGEDKHFNELRKEMRDIQGSLGNISALLSDLKIKKSWFKF